MLRNCSSPDVVEIARMAPVPVRPRRNMSSNETVVIKIIHLPYMSLLNSRTMNRKRNMLNAANTIFPIREWILFERFIRLLNLFICTNYDIRFSTFFINILIFERFFCISPYTSSRFSGEAFERIV